MLCDNCNQNEATVKYTQIVNGEKKQVFLCTNCAREMGIDNFSFDMPINLSNFFGDLLGEYDDSPFIPQMIGYNEPKCSNCGMTYEEFKENGKMGCSECYETFSEKLDPLLKRLHGSTKHSGRKSEISKNKENIKKKTNDKTEKIEELKEEIKKLVKEEKYEEAAKIRDEIKKLNGDGENCN